MSDKNGAGRRDAPGDWPAYLTAGLSDEDETLRGLIGQGLRLPEIAIRLRLEPDGVRRRLDALYLKVGATTRALIVELLLDKEDAGH